MSDDVKPALAAPPVSVRRIYFRDHQIGETGKRIEELEGDVAMFKNAADQLADMQLDTERDLVSA